MKQKEHARTQSLFREVNERIDQLALGGAIEFICECSNPECTETIRMVRCDYEAIRGHSARFPILPGHEQPDVERIVEESEGYVVVEKIELAKTVAEKLDPRARN
jgi:hypothetical protein